MKFTNSHEWVDIKQGTDIATIGITQYAQKELGEIVYVELPEVGKTVKAEAEVAVLESTKAAADVYAPISGVIVEVNKTLTTESNLINKSPEKDGWIFKLKMTDPSELKELMDSDAYHAQFNR